jgi:hypothetical protein
MERLINGITCKTIIMWLEAALKTIEIVNICSLISDEQRLGLTPSHIPDVTAIVYPTEIIIIRATISAEVLRPKAFVQ